MYLPFEKWHGARNDFIVTWLNPTDNFVFEAIKKQAVHLCARNGSSIGADGVLVLHKNAANDILPQRLTIINSDGSLAKTCGNGIRCAAGSILRRIRKEGHKSDLTDGIQLQLEDGLVVARFLTKGELSLEQSTIPLVAVEMGVPELNEASPYYGAAQEEVKKHHPSFPYELSVCSISNHHLIFFAQGEATRDHILELGPSLQDSKHWDGINVHIAQEMEISDKKRTQIANELGEPIEELYQAFTWERGAGETQACGSGACAIAASVLSSGLVSRTNWIGVEMPGGRLYLKQDDPADPIVMAGPAAFVFEGVVEI